MWPAGHNVFMDNVQHSLGKVSAELKEAQLSLTDKPHIYHHDLYFWHLGQGIIACVSKGKNTLFKTSSYLSHRPTTRIPTNFIAMEIKVVKLGFLLLYLIKFENIQTHVWTVEKHFQHPLRQVLLEIVYTLILILKMLISSNAEWYLINANHPLAPKSRQERKVFLKKHF